MKATINKLAVSQSGKSISASLFSSQSKEIAYGLGSRPTYLGIMSTVNNGDKTTEELSDLLVGAVVEVQEAKNFEFTDETTGEVSVIKIYDFVSVVSLPEVFEDVKPVAQVKVKPVVVRK